MISLLMTVKNRALQFKRGLRTVLGQNFKPDEIIVIDDGSNDDPQSVVVEARKVFPSIEFIRLNHLEWRLSCHAKNVGLKAAKGDVIVYTDPEVLHVGETLHAVVSWLERNVPAAQRIWTMGPIVWRDLGEDWFAEPARLLSHPGAMFTQAPDMHNTHADADHAITGSFSPTGCLFACAREDLMAIGGWDEAEMSGFGWEDFDLFARLGLYGRLLLWVNDVDIIHQWHRKDYGFNIYEAAERNGKVSEARVHRGEYRVNQNFDWGNPNA